MIKKETVEVRSLASEWFYKGFHAQWDNWMAGGWGQDDAGYFRAAILLLKAAGYHENEIDRIAKEQQKVHENWAADYRRQYEKK